MIIDSIDKPLPSKFHSVDPAPSFGGAAASLSVKGLQQQLMDESAPLYDRYRAMFALRDISTTSSALALCTAFDKPCEGRITANATIFELSVPWRHCR